MALVDAQNLLRAGTDLDIARSLFGSLPWIFKGDADQFAAWRDSVAATNAKLVAGGLFVVGSAAYGFSPSPRKAGRDFRASGGVPYLRSDIDVVIVSEPLFTEIWNDIVSLDRAHALGLSFDERQKMHDDVYQGHIANTLVPSGSEPARILRTAMGKTTSQLPFRGHVAKSRVYRRQEDAIAYHVWSTGELRREMRV